MDIDSEHSSRMVLTCGSSGWVFMVGDGVYIQTTYGTMVFVSDLEVSEVAYHTEWDEPPNFITTVAGCGRQDAQQDRNVNFP